MKFSTSMGCRNRSSRTKVLRSLREYGRSRWRRLAFNTFFAAAEHQQTNGLVERNNGVLVDRLAAFIEETPDVWDAQLSAAVFAINTSVQASTLTVPFQALFGLLPRLLVEALLPKVPDPEAGERRDEQMERLRASMAARSQAAQQRQKANYDRRRLPT